MIRKTMTTLAIALLALLAAPSYAAFIHIDDSDLDTITISVGDFENGFSVNGNLLASGLGSRGSITLKDGVSFRFAGTWIDLGATTSGDGFSAFFGTNSVVQSGVEAKSDRATRSRARVNGGGAGFDFNNDYGVSSPNPQDGSRVNFSLPYLSGYFISEVAAVPEPGVPALLLLGAISLGLSRRRKRCA